MPIFNGLSASRVQAALGSDAGVEHGWGVVSLTNPDGSSKADGTTRAFDLPYARVRALVVVVGGLQQPPNIYSLVAGAGTGGVDRLLFNPGNAPPNGATLEVSGTRAV